MHSCEFSSQEAISLTNNMPPNINRKTKTEHDSDFFRKLPEAKKQGNGTRLDCLEWKCDFKIWFSFLSRSHSNWNSPSQRGSDAEMFAVCLWELLHQEWICEARRSLSEDREMCGQQAIKQKRAGWGAEGYWWSQSGFPFLSCASLLLEKPTVAQQNTLLNGSKKATAGNVTNTTTCSSVFNSLP